MGTFNSTALPDYDVTQVRVSDYTTGMLTIPVSVGTQMAEPSIVYEPQGWNGYPFWMVVAPFDGTDASTENPEIFTSLNGKTWVKPAGLINPVAPAPVNAPTNYNSDPYMTFSPDRSQLIVIYRQIFGANSNTLLISSTNGITWTAPVTIISTVRAAEDLIQSSVVYNSVTGLWTLYACDPVKPNNQLVYATASSLTGTWSARSNCIYSLPPGETSLWHCDIQALSSGVLVGIAQTGSNAGGKLYPMRSTDGVTFTYGPLIMNRSTTGCYKSGFVPIDDKWYTYFGFIANPAWKLEFGILSFDLNIWQLVRSSFLASNANSPLPLLGGAITWDSFDRADSAVSLGSPTAGSAWVADGGRLGILNNTAYPPTAGNNKAYINSGFADVDIRAEFPTAATNGGARLTWRGTGTNDFFRAIIYSGRVQVEEITAAAIVNTWTRTWTVVNGDELRIRAKGNNHQIYINGILIIAFSTAVRNTATRHGLQLGTVADTVNNYLLTKA